MKHTLQVAAAALVLSIVVFLPTVMAQPTVGGSVNGTAISPSSVVATSGKFDVLDAGTMNVEGSLRAAGSITTPGYVHAAAVEASTGGIYMSTADVEGILFDGTDMRMINRFGAITPNTDQAANFGKVAVRWSHVYATDLHLNGTTTSVGSCTLNGGTPSQCSAAVNSGTKCTCSVIATTAAGAALGCAVYTDGGSSMTVTSAAAATNVVNYHCF